MRIAENIPHAPLAPEKNNEPFPRSEDGKRVSEAFYWDACCEKEPIPPFTVAGRAAFISPFSPKAVMIRT
jgi:hypothetical protein